MGPGISEQPLLRRDDTFGAKIQDNETSAPFLYCHAIAPPTQCYPLPTIESIDIDHRSTGPVVQNLE